MHMVIGFLGTELFDFTAMGVVYALILVCLTQPSELMRQYGAEKKKVGNMPAHKRKSAMEEYDKNFKKEFAQTLIQNIVMYLAIVLLAAEIARSSGIAI